MAKNMRIVVVGNSCSGKTTLARALVKAYGTSHGLRHVELDSLFWDRGWAEATPEIFSARVKEALASDAWVADGNYLKYRQLLWSRADTVIWLDFPLPIILLRFFRRSLFRSLTRKELWNGNRETFRNNLLGRHSLLAWILTSHATRRAQLEALVRAPELAHLRFVRARTPAAARNAVAALAERRARECH